MSPAESPTAASVAAADAAKTSTSTEPIRIVAIGVAGASEGRLIAISGPNVADGDITKDTDVIIGDFSELATILSDLALELCGGTISVHKVIDDDGDLGTTHDQTTSGSDVTGWTFTPAVTGGSADPTSDTTDSSGDAGAIVEGGAGLASDKIAALESAGVSVAEYPENISDFLK